MVSLMMVVMEFTMVEDGDSVPDDGDGGVNHDGEDGDGVPYDGGCGIHYGEDGDGVSDDGNGGGVFFTIVRMVMVSLMMVMVMVSLFTLMMVWRLVDQVVTRHSSSIVTTALS